MHLGRIDKSAVPPMLTKGPLCHILTYMPPDNGRGLRQPILQFRAALKSPFNYLLHIVFPPSTTLCDFA